LSQSIYGPYGLSDLQYNVAWWYPNEDINGFDDLYLTNILPRLRPTLPGYLGLTWQDANRSYFRAGQFSGSLGFENYLYVFVGENATTTGSSNSSLFYVYPYCIDNSTSQLGYLNSTFDTTVNGSTASIAFTSTNFTYVDSACGDWLAMFYPMDLPFNWDDYRGILTLNNTFMSDSSSYECVSTDTYQWVSFNTKSPP
jgi:hypothetical protein